MSDRGPDCMETLREIERYLDGELQGDLRIKVQVHLSGCNPCMDRTEFRRHLKDMIASKCGGDEPPPELFVRIRALIEERDVSP
ncbi:MAG: zf-HC2 domain-containing protein [Actinomycetota bacterium]